MPELLVPEDPDEGRLEPEQSSPSALAILNQSEHASMVQTANAIGNRRTLKDFESKLKLYTTYTQSVALSMFYSLPRANKQIIGPSVRFAEVVAPCWKNCRTASRAMGDAGNIVTAMGVFIDYEANHLNAVEVPRRITDKNGNRFNDDMIVTTLNAAMSVAKRNAVLKGGVPQALWTPAYEEAQLVAVGKGVQHSQRVSDAMEHLHKLGVTEWQILNSVGVTSQKELEMEHLVTLRVLYAEVKRGEKTIESIFGSEYDKEIETLSTQLKMNDAQRTMLRREYMGRAKELADYLRQRLGPARSTAAVEVKPAVKPEPAAVQQQQEAQEALVDILAQQFNERQQQVVMPSVHIESAAGIAFESEPAPAPVKRGRPNKAAQPIQPSAQESEPAQQEAAGDVAERDEFAF